MSFLKSKLSGWLADGTRTPYMGGGGGSPGPSTTYSQTSNIPEYAKPYVQTMLGATQKQMFTMNGDTPSTPATYDSQGNELTPYIPGTTGGTEVTGFQPYKPYSTDMGDYVAGFSPLQQQAQSGAANLQVPGQYGQASQMTGIAGAGSLASAGQAGGLGNQALGYGQAGSMYGGLGAQQAISAAQQAQNQAAGYGGMGAGYGAQAAGQAQQGYGAGAQYAQQATNPASTAAYMSPYMQNVVDYQKSQALRDYEMAAPYRAAKAVGAGAFGGSRQAIESSEAQRSLMSQLQGIEATGAQDAFKNAQQQQQFGANLGLQGLQAGYQGTGMGIQGAQTGLAGVGQQLAGGQLGLAGTAQGIQGAQVGQAGVSGAVNAGQYGLQGLNQYGQMAGQLGQLGTAQLAAQQGIIGTQGAQGLTQQQQEQSKINQAIQDYATQQQYPMMQLGFMSNMLRGLPMQAQSTQMYQAQPSTLQQGIGLLGAGASLYGAQKAGGGQIKEMAEGGIASYKYGGAIPDQKLEGMAGKLDIEQLQQRLADKELDRGERQVFEDALSAKTKDKARYAGIAGAGGGLFNTMGYAGGGILAFAGEDGSEVKDKEINQKPTTVAEQLALQRSLGPKGKLGETTEEDIADRPAQGDKRFDKAQRLAETRGFIKFGSTAAPGGIGQAALAGLDEYTNQYSKAIEGQEAFKAETAKMNRELENARRAEERGDVKTATESQAKYEDIQARLKAAQISAAASHAAVNLKQEEKNAIKADLTKSLGREPTMAEILSAYAKATSVADESSDARLRVAANTAYQKWEASLALDRTFIDLQKKAVKGDEAAAAKIEQIKSAKRQQINAEIMGTQTAAAPAPTPSVMSPDKDGNIQVPGKGTFKQLPNGNYVKVG